MFSADRSRVKKAGEPPGTPTYTGTKHKQPTWLEVTYYNALEVTEKKGVTVEECLTIEPYTGITWVDLYGLNNTALVQQLADRFHLHPLTVEDILTVSQRPKVEEFDDYTFVVMKKLHWRKKSGTFSIQPLSLILGSNFVLTFQDSESSLFRNIHTRLASNPNQRLRQQGSDYLLYRLIDAVVDQYFVVIEELSERVEKLEEKIIANPTPQNARSIYKLKRQMLLLRKVVWPMRESLGHLMHSEDSFISKFTALYMRDVYDHSVQALDTIDTFRDMLSSLLDMYLSSLTNRMNEIMKTLTIITTIFIPITAIASIYGMNFTEIPGLHWEYGYPTALAAMLSIAIGMLIYFKFKKWI